MTREEVFALIQAHLVDELDIDPARIDESTSFRADLEADSLDLYTLVQELEDSYGVKMPDEQAAKIVTVGQAVDYVLAQARRPRADRVLKLLTELLEELPDSLHRQVFTHASWTERRSDSYSRLAFLGDSVLGLALTAHLYPRLEAERFGAGRLTKIRAQSVSGVSCRAVAERLGVPDLLRAAAPARRRPERRVARRDRARAGVGDRGRDRRVLPARRLRAHRRRRRRGLPAGDQQRAAASGRLQVDAAGAPRARARRPSSTRSTSRPDRRTTARSRSLATVDGAPVGRGAGRSKKHAEQEAARIALETLHPDAPVPLDEDELWEDLTRPCT